MIFCTRKIKKEKVGGHKQISFRSFKDYVWFRSFYSVDESEKALGKVTFPNYEKYNINKAYNDFFSENDWGG